MGAVAKAAACNGAHGMGASSKAAHQRQGTGRQRCPSDGVLMTGTWGRALVGRPPVESRQKLEGR
eukprot:54419-Chlamydomonas_euryale.AAC.1